MRENCRLTGKKVLVTGAAGSVGKALLEKLGDRNPSLILGLDNDEEGLFEAALQTSVEFSPVLCDVRDKASLEKTCRDVDIIFHLAALKHVPLSEAHPLEAIKTNILGVGNLIDAAISNGVEQVINTSTDKAVNPTNVMGTSKLMGEHLIRTGNFTSSHTKFTSIRFGNVLGSSGSVIPIFREQIRSGGPVTLTSRKMTRFIMTLQEAVELVIESLNLDVTGATYVTKMNAIRVETLAQVMIEELGEDKLGSGQIEITEIGPRPGEKLFEELMNAEEARRSIELTHHYVILPAITDYSESPSESTADHNQVTINQYNSSTQEHLSKEELRAYLKSSAVL